MMNGHGPPLQPRPMSRLSRIILVVSLSIVLLLVCLQGKVLLVVLPQRASEWQMQQQQQQQQHAQQPQQCQWYLAESALPKAGLGVYTAVGLHRGDRVGNMDICIYVSDAPELWTHLRSHSFGTGTFFGQVESRWNRAACEGFTTIYNTVPDLMVNTEMVSPTLPTHAGLHRNDSPGAGAITHFYGMHGRAKDIIAAGSELTINYGDWDFDENPMEQLLRPQRPVSWLQQHGWCVDHIDIGISRIPNAGRGAFAKRSFAKGEIVAPAPLQVFNDMDLFQGQLFLNYCLEPEDMDVPIFFYPYGPAVNLINHHAKSPNVKFQWSQHSMNHASWLDLPYSEFWKVVYPGGLILEVVALRDIEYHEEILLDYGPAWDLAWKEHVQQWKERQQDFINDNKENPYVYPAEMDETEPLRTVAEQLEDPYPYNLVTMCVMSDWRDGKDSSYNQTWREPTEWEWHEGMAFCRIWERTLDPESATEVYTVELIFSNDPKVLSMTSRPASDAKKKKLYFDTNVPRRAIRFVEIPYMDDEHLPHAFRHPIGLPADLIPEAWRNPTEG